MNLDDAHLCLRAGVDVLGFVVEYPRPVPWNLNHTKAKELISAFGGKAKTCMVTGGKPARVLELVNALGKQAQPSYIQLHDSQSPSDTKALVDDLGAKGIKVIKTLFPNTAELEQTALDFCDIGVFALLFDPRTPENATRGGSVDVSAFRLLKQAVSCPVILAGGITPQNAVELIQETEAEMIDLMTGVEHHPGHKDPEKLSALMRALEPVT